MTSSRQRSSSARSNQSESNNRQHSTPSPGRFVRLSPKLPEENPISDVPAYTANTNNNSTLVIPLIGPNSPYPTLNTSRPRAQTEHGTAPVGSVLPGRPQYPPGNRFVPPGLTMDNQRPQYIPGPPPPPSTQPHLMPLPPPPPRPPPQQQQTGILPPPPPPPPGTGFGMTGGWQQPWARPGLAGGLPPPPPTINPNQATNQHLAYSATHLAQPRQLAHLRIPGPPVNDQPAMFSTFIPGPDSFGPGVGIPPLEDSQSSTYSRHDNYGYNDGSRSAGSQTYADGFGDISGYQFAAANGKFQDVKREKETPPTPISKHPMLTLPPRAGADAVSPGPLTATLANPQARSNGQGHGVHRTNTSIPTVSSSSSSAQEWMSQWTLDRVVAWLSEKGFSKDWQEAFRSLEIQGPEFIELGRGANGRAPLQKMYETILPQLAKICTSSGTGWDQHREREEGKRMRKLIRRIGDSSSAPTLSAGAIGHRRRDSAQLLPSASTEGTVADSPNLPSNWSATPSTAGPEGSPGKAMPAKLANGLGPKNSVEKRNAALPLHTSQGNTPNDDKPPESFHGHNRADFSKNILQNLSKGKHSPHTSTDAASASYSGVGYRQYEGSPQSGSPALGHAAPTSATTTSSSPHGRVEHSKSNSTDSLLKSGFARGGIFGSAHGDASVPSRQDHRKNTTESSRPSPLEGGRQWSNETTSATKDHSKGFLDKFLKRKKQPETQPSPDESYLDSPTSPADFRTVPPSLVLARSKANGNDAAVAERPGSAAATPDHEKANTRGRLHAASTIPKRFVMVTPDQWNYRLIDVTDCDSAYDLRNLICLELGIPDPDFAQIFLTETGQTEHEEPLNDTMLIVHRRTKSDQFGTLKFFVQSPATASGAVPPPQSAGLGLTFPRTLPSPHIMSAYGKRGMDEESYAKLVFTAQNVPASPYTTVRDGQNHSTEMARNASQQSQIERELEIQKASEKYNRENERKQRAYQESRQQKRESPSTFTSAGIRGKPIDFDSPRNSPYDEKKTETLVPFRKAPTAPSESNTLAKVNSLTKRSGEKIRLSGHSDQFKRASDPILEESTDRGRRRGIAPTLSVSHGLGAAIANVGKMVGTPAAVGSQGNETSQPRPQRAMQSVDFGFGGSRGNSPGGSPRSPRYIWSKGNMMFKNPDFVEGEQQDNSHNVPALQLPKNLALEQVSKREPSPAVSPASDSPPAWGNKPDRKSYGPNFDFSEPNVPFAPSPMPPEDTDDDSDDGLFAIPLTNNKTPKKPALTVRTETLSKKNSSVRIKSPQTSGDTSGPSIHTPETDRSDSTGRSRSDPMRSNSATTRGDNRSPEQTKPDSLSSDGWTNRPTQRTKPTRSPKRRDPKRDSFASDIWANRPPIEGVINHLDEFFPNIDLDEPYLEEGNEGPVTPSSSADSAPNEGPIATLRDRAAFGLDGIPLGLKMGNENDTLGSDESTLKAKDRDTVASVVAQRQMRKSGGLGRMKSIREVAKGRNELSRARSSVAGGPPAVQNNASGIIRRKSTKMFGANIVQIQPKPGNRLSTLDPIPQDEVPQEDAPRRQATFRIIRGQLIGKGTYGRVYLGMNATTGEFLAVKQVEVNQTHYDKERVKDMVAALDQEIDTMQHLEHPNIVQYLGCERKEFSISIYLEYISGGSVGSCLRKHGKFEEGVVRSLTRQTLAGLAYLHNEGILHRDLKADNILLDVDGTCRISDFGISKKSDNVYGNDVTNSMQGSVFWMAPEVVRSQGQGYSAKVDIWSLGCVVLEMFAGRRPWSREEAIGAIFKLGSLNQAPPIPDDVSAAASVEGVNFMYDCFET
ncbi:MAG: hypothetical protein Q9160_000217 [Pyrenula sp. 1 TL-2023]